MTPSKPVGIWIRVLTEEQVKWDKYHNAFQFLNIEMEVSAAFIKKVVHA